MLAIYEVSVMSILSIIFSFLVWNCGYKKLGIYMFRGTIGLVLMYIFMVLIIGLAPTSLG